MEFTYQLIKFSPPLTESNCIKRLPDNAFIPFDPANQDFVEYNKWLSLGNQPLPPDAEENL